MIIRTSRGEKGIAEYLKHGAKQGRNYTRDALDDRVVLAGDLDVTDRVIGSMNSDEGVSRYLHITQSFKEDVIDPDVLRKIAAESVAFYSAAYNKNGKSELDIYAEAHIPKVLNYIGNQGEEVDRKGHIHFVIPMTNLSTGEREDPLGYSTANYGTAWSNNDFVKAFQEEINDKYGLASPDDSRNPSSRSAVLDRVKPASIENNKQSFIRSGDEMRAAIMRDVIANDVTTRLEFQKILAKYGDVSVPSKTAPYFKIQCDGEKIKHRLKDKIFTDEFIALTTADKKLWLESNDKNEFIEAKSPDEIAAQELTAERVERQRMIQYWHDIRSRENRYIHQGDKFYKNTYRFLTDSEKIDVLDRAERGEIYKDNQRAAPTSDRFNTYTAEQVAENLAEGEKLIAGDSDSIVTMIDRLTENQSAFSRSELEKYLAERMDIGEIETVVQHITRHDYFVAVDRIPDAELDPLADESANNDEEKSKYVKKIKEKNLYTSRKIYDIETSMMSTAVKLKGEGGAAISFESVDTSSMNTGQLAAMRALCGSDRVAIANGAAGTGKSYVLKRMKEAYESKGYTLYGAILQGKTAQDLEKDSGIKSSTLHSFLSNVENGKIILNEKSVIVVDEAGMVGSEQMAKVIKLADEHGCRVRMVGDTYQVQSVSYGAAFEKISKVFGVANLDQIMRQKTDWQLAASMAMSKHDINTGISAYADHGHVHVEKEHFDAIDVLAKRVIDDRRAGIAGTSIVVCKTRAERAELNSVIRHGLIEDGIVSDTEKSFIVNAEGRKIELATGDIVMFGKTDKIVKNGSSGRVEMIDDQHIYLECEGKHFSITRESDAEIEQGYAITINKSQGMTVDRSYVLASKYMTANDTYVAMTRHKESVEIYASNEHFENFDSMIKCMSRKSTKEFVGDDEEKLLDVNAIDSIVREHTVEAMIERDTKKEMIKKLKLEIDLPNLLIKLENENGLNANKFSVNRENNTIVAGRTEYDSIQFLTKVMKQDYKTEALPKLRETYRDQLRGVYAEKQEPITTQERKDFALWMRSREAAHQHEITALNQSARAGKSAARGTSDADVLTAIQNKLEVDRKSLETAHSKPNRIIFNEFRQSAEQQQKRITTQLTTQQEIQNEQNEQRNRELETEQIPPPHLRNRVLDLSACNVVLDLGEHEQSLQQNAHGDVERAGAKQDPDLFRKGRGIESDSGKEGKTVTETAEVTRARALMAQLEEQLKPRYEQSDIDRAKAELAEMQARREAEITNRVDAVVAAGGGADRAAIEAAIREEEEERRQLLAQQNQMQV